MLANILQEFASPLNKGQTDKLKEAVGDLSFEQINWLSGYLAGLVASGAAKLNDVGSATPRREIFQSSTALEGSASSNQSEIGQMSVATILYASQTGNAKGIATALNKTLHQNGIEARLINMADYKIRDFKKERQLYLVVSTHGEGDPPDDALELYDHLHSQKAPKLGQLSYAVLALGDSSYQHYCQTGKEFDAVFQALGATKLLERVDCDVDYSADSLSWQSQVVALSKTPGDRKRSLDSVEGAANKIAQNKKVQLSVVDSEPTAFDKFSPFEAEVIEAIKITADESDKPTFHIEIDLEASELTYEPGDSLGVWPVNSEQLVEETLSVINATGNESVQLEEHSMTLHQALKNHYELTQISPQLVRTIAKKNQHLKLLSLLDDTSKLSQWIPGFQVPELLKCYPVSLALDEFVSSLRKLSPRLYSIASSQQEVESEVHLTVGLVDELRSDTHRYGAASHYLSQLKTGDKVRVYVEKNRNFKLPVDLNTPIIMIAAGTGVAPFRGFMQQRVAQNAKGKNWLIFGNRHFSSDFLYQLEWQGWLKVEQLERIDLAFSRDQNVKIYVQDRIRENAGELYRWIQKGAHIYVCGDKQRLGQSVEQALLDVFCSQANATREQAQQELLVLRKSGRYQKDVY